MSSQDILTLVALQIEPSSNLSDIFSQIAQLIEMANKEQDSLDCIVLPEYAFGTFREWAATKAHSDIWVKSIHKSIGNMAQQYRVPMVAGTVPYQTETKQWRNRCFVFSASGEIIGFSDKQHPFRTEKLLGLEPGVKTSIFQLEHLRMAVLICSDLWYHDTIAEIASKVDFIAVPTMTTVLNPDHIHYGQWAWQSLVGVRAKEYTIPIISADQASREYAPGVFTCGGTCIADPSYRFSNDEGADSQALKRASNEKSQYVISQISLQSLRQYAAYRRDVGLRE